MLRAMRRALLLVFALAPGCRDAELGRLTALRDTVCACKTASCGEQAVAKIGAAQPGGGDATASHLRQDRAREMMDCLAKLYLAERPSTDPDAEAPIDAAP